MSQLALRLTDSTCFLGKSRGCLLSVPNTKSQSMKRALRQIGIIVASLLLIYVGSFFVVLMGARMRSVTWLDNAGLTYKLNSFTNEHGFEFTNDPWMKIFRPLYCPRTIYRPSDDPKEEVDLSLYGEMMFAVYYWGMWPDEDWSKAVYTARSWTGNSYESWYPEQFKKDKDIDNQSEVGNQK